MRKKMKDGSYKYFLRVETQFVEVSEAVHKAYYSENWKVVYSFMHTHGFCRCNNGYHCEGDCSLCPYRCKGNGVSLEEMLDSGAEPVNENIRIQEEIENCILLQSLMAAAREQVVDGEKILRLMIMEYPEREISEMLGIPKTTLHRHIVKIRKVLDPIRKKFFEESGPEE
ncbi:MAG: hypothetical protein K2J08_06340 [Ruminococcus sp.]|nr:hypothetical protein [Ruminococcus sp.]